MYIPDEYERLKDRAETSFTGKDGYKKIMRKFHKLRDKAFKETYKLIEVLEEKERIKFRKKFPVPPISFDIVKEKKVRKK